MISNLDANGSPVRIGNCLDLGYRPKLVALGRSGVLGSGRRFIRAGFVASARPFNRIQAATETRQTRFVPPRHCACSSRGGRQALIGSSVPSRSRAARIPSGCIAHGPMAYRSASRCCIDLILKSIYLIDRFAPKIALFLIGYFILFSACVHYPSGTQHRCFSRWSCGGCYQAGEKNVRPV
jgi:hypothetical protein